MLNIESRILVWIISIYAGLYLTYLIFSLKLFVQLKLYEIAVAEEINELLTQLEPTFSGLFEAGYPKNIETQFINYYVATEIASNELLQQMHNISENILTNLNSTGNICKKLEYLLLLRFVRRNYNKEEEE